jgi:pimeloyl-ACP methyl ester carboxylesterase
MGQVVDTFLRADIVGRLRMALAPDTRDEVAAYLGERAFAEYEALARTTDLTEHLGGDAPTMLFVPGVMGSLLYSHNRGGVWWIDVLNRKRIDDLRLSPDGSGDAEPANAVTPFTTASTYDPFRSMALADEPGHEAFPYDWRKSLLRSARPLRDAVLRIHEANGNRPVHLVAHSMGGLLVRTALMEHGDDLWPRIGRIVFVGTPHYGSPAIASYLRSHLSGFDLMALLGRYISRRTFRSLWGVLGLLPAPADVYPGSRNGGGHPCVDFDLYDVNAWGIKLDPVGSNHLQRVLDAAADLHRRLYHHHLELDDDQRDRMLMIAGVGQKTLFRLETGRRRLGLASAPVKVTTPVPGDVNRDGDGRVPLASAQLELVRTRYIKGVHGGLTNIPAVYRDIVAFLNGGRLRLSSTVDEAVAPHLAGTDSSVAPHLDGSAAEDPWQDDPSPERLDALDDALARGLLPEFVNVRLL